MTETTIITTPYPPTSEIICALINKGWCIDSVKRETCKDDFDHYVLTAHVVEVPPMMIPNLLDPEVGG